jgi:LysW-gamma-L-lysine carboxypeptidase
MLETYSPSGSEASLATMLKTEMKSLGFDSRIDEAGNVIGTAGEEGPEILLCGHMDTVPGEIAVRLENEFLYGRGAVDAKSSLATMLIGASRALLDSKTPLRGRLVCVVKEETTSEGFRSVLEKGSMPHFAIFGEPSGLTNMIIGYKGRIHLQIDCATEGGHSASPWLYRNSAEEAYRFWLLLRESILENEAASKFESVTGSLTGMATSGPENSIPSLTRLTLDVRLPPNTGPREVVGRVESIAQSYSDQHPGVRLSTIVKDSVPPYLGDAHSKLVAACRGAIRRVSGRVPSMVKKTGTGDMNLLRSGTSAIAYGPGDSRLDHTDQERISVDEYLKSIEVYAETLKLLSRMTVPEIGLAA